jgi:hypothetical protein
MSYSYEKLPTSFNARYKDHSCASNKKITLLAGSAKQCISGEYDRQGSLDIRQTMMNLSYIRPHLTMKARRFPIHAHINRLDLNNKKMK